MLFNFKSYNLLFKESPLVSVDFKLKKSNYNIGVVKNTNTVVFVVGESDSNLEELNKYEIVL